MNLEIPPHLHAIRDLLIASMKTHPTEVAPAIPRELLKDLSRSVGAQPTEMRQSRFAGIVSMLRSMLATPAFGSVAAVILILAVASSVVLSSKKETFRGTGNYAPTEFTRVILVGAPVGQQRDLEAISDFQSGIFLSAETAESTINLEGPLVIVDFTTQTITGFNAEDELVYETTLPESTSGISLEISYALTRL